MCVRESKWVCRTLLVKYSGHATGSACVCVLPCFVLQVSSIAVLHNLWNSSEEENQKFQSSPSVLSQFVPGLTFILDSVLSNMVYYISVPVLIMSMRDMQ